MKRAACVLTLVFAPLLAIGCDSPEPPVAMAPSQPDPAPPPGKIGPRAAARKKKQPGIHSPVSPTAPKANF